MRDSNSIHIVDLWTNREDDVARPGVDRSVLAPQVQGDPTPFLSLDSIDTMIRSLPPNLARVPGEDRVALQLLLAGSEARPVLRSALALANAEQRGLRSFCVEAPGSHLPPRLSRAIHGDLRSEADYAIRNLIESASRGTRLPLSPRPAPPDPAAAPASAPGPAAAEIPRIVGWLKGARRPPLSDVKRFRGKGDGRFLLLADVEGRPFDEILALAVGELPGAAMDALKEQVRFLEGSYPVWRQKISKPSKLDGVLADLRPTSLLLLVLPTPPAEPFEALPGRLEELAPGPVGLLLPGDARYDPVLSSIFSDRPDSSAPTEEQ
ncbi:MAG: hypothetical protein VX498_07960 [Myxococcota bacterium]|nr:hypothetical protein [Myxococcota bacterium]